MRSKRGSIPIFLGKNRKGLSAVVTTVILVALSMAAVVLVWVFVNNLLKGQIQSSESCFGNYDKVTINRQYTCYEKIGNNYSVRFSLLVGNSNVDKVLVSVSSANAVKSYELTNTAQELSDLITYPEGTENVKLPDKNSGLTYKASGFASEIDSVQIAPVVGGTQCDISDSLFNLEQCTDSEESVVEEENPSEEFLTGLGAIAWWRLNGNAEEEIGGSSGDVIGDTNFVEGKFLEAASLDGDGDYIDVGVSPAFNLNQLTLSMWVKTPSITGQKYRAFIGKQGSVRDYNFYAVSEDHIKVNALHFSSALFGSSSASLPSAYEPQTWHHVAVTVNSAGLQKFYSDGVYLAQSQGTPGVASHNYPVRIGVADNFWNGQIDEVVIFNRALTDEEIQELYGMDFSE